MPHRSDSLKGAREQAFSPKFVKPARPHPPCARRISNRTHLRTRRKKRRTRPRELPRDHGVIPRQDLDIGASRARFVHRHADAHVPPCGRRGDGAEQLPFAVGEPDGDAVPVRFALRFVSYVQPASAFVPHRADREPRDAYARDAPLRCHGVILRR
jgi:hypothetical protein